MEEDKFNVKLHIFDGTNFSNWKFRLLTALDEHELTVFVENDLASILALATSSEQRDKLKLKEKSANQ